MGSINVNVESGFVIPGIIGREGRQASRAADFAVPGFQYLKKAILVHGHWYYYRLATLVAYFFYRGLLFVLPQFLYGFDTGFSGQVTQSCFYLGKLFAV